MGISRRQARVPLFVAAPAADSHFVHQIDFPAMGSQFTVIAVDCGLEVAEAMMALALQLEQRWSRFRDDSELMRLNNSPGIHLEVSDPTIRLIQRMVEGALLTNGAYDPNVLGAMIDNGFGTSRRDPQLSTKWGARTAARGDVHGICIDDSAGTVMLPLGVGLDPGGIGKGLAADLIVERAQVLGAGGACVFAGGDVRVWGMPPTESGWTIGVEDPLDETAYLDVLEVADGGVAVSCADGWTSTHGGHIVDARVQRPSVSKVMQAAVVTGEATSSEYLTKVAFNRSIEETLSLYDSVGAQAQLVFADRNVVETQGWESLCT